MVGKDGAATLIDFGVPRHHSVPISSRRARARNPGYQAPELLMTDMLLPNATGRRIRRWTRSPWVHALLPVHRARAAWRGERRGGDDGDDCGARTKTKNRAMGADARGRSHGRRRRLQRQRRGRNASLGRKPKPIAARRRGRAELRRQARRRCRAGSALLRARERGGAPDDRRELDVDWKCCVHSGAAR